MVNGGIWHLASMFGIGGHINSFHSYIHTETGIHPSHSIPHGMRVCPMPTIYYDIKTTNKNKRQFIVHANKQVSLCYALAH